MQHRDSLQEYQIMLRPGMRVELILCEESNVERIIGRGYIKELWPGELRFLPDDTKETISFVFKKEVGGWKRISVNTGVQVAGETEPAYLFRDI